MNTFLKVMDESWTREMIVLIIIDLNGWAATQNTGLF